MDSLRGMRRLRRRVRVHTGADPSVTRPGAPVSGMAALTELIERLTVIRLLDAAIGRSRPANGGVRVGSCWSGSPPLSWPGRTCGSGWTADTTEPAGNPPKTALGGHGYRHGKTQTLSQGRLREVATP